MALAFGIAGSGWAAAAPSAAENSSPSHSKTHTSSHHSWFEVGKASWYGGKFNGRRTALGERFDMNALTCAHRTLPLGSWLRVTNLRNKRSTFVRINDRGPVSESLMVDLSYAAARKLGISGLGTVKIEKVSRETVLREKPAPARKLQAPLFELASNAEGVPILPPAIADR
jgi:rare lipoprotein A